VAIVSAIVAVGAWTSGQFAIAIPASIVALVAGAFCALAGYYCIQMRDKSKGNGASLSRLRPGLAAASSAARPHYGRRCGH